LAARHNRIELNSGLPTAKSRRDVASGGLCTSVKHSSRSLRSACRQRRLPIRIDIPFPFCLVDNDYKHDRLVLSPGYWWTSNMYALMRNEAKFFARDNRCDKTLRFEYSPFAPDTAEEILSAIALIEDWTGRSFKTYREENPSEQSPETFATLIEALPARIETMTSGASEAFAALGRAVLNAGQDILPFESRPIASRIRPVNA